jgi:hypothetical protein
MSRHERCESAAIPFAVKVAQTQHLRHQPPSNPSKVSIGIYDKEGRREFRWLHPCRTKDFQSLMVLPTRLKLIYHKWVRLSLLSAYQNI